MDDETKATIAVSLWCIAFNGGILLAAEHKAVGFMIAVSATLIFLVYLAGDIRLEAEKKRRKNTAHPALLHSWDRRSILLLLSWSGHTEPLERIPD